MKNWINILHFYQPSWQDKDILNKVIKESYSFLLSLLTKFPNFKITANFSGSLLELLDHYDRQDIIESFKHFIENGQIELMASAIYHPLLAKLPKVEVIRQIKLNQELLHKYFVKNQEIRGFFIPELAYHPDLAQIIKEMGYSWIVLDEICSSEEIDNDFKYLDQKSGLEIIFRNRKISKSFAPEFLSLSKENNQTYIDATDAELYGHWHDDWQSHSQQVLKNNSIKTLKVSEYLKTKEKSKEIILRPGNWESSSAEIETKDYYHIWDNPQNQIQQNLWALSNLAYQSLKVSSVDYGFKYARNLMDKAWSSCYWWWASGRKLSSFSPVAWHPDIIIKGLDMMIRVIRSLQTLDSNIKIKAEKIYTDTVYLVWKKHWSQNE